MKKLLLLNLILAISFATFAQQVLTYDFKDQTKDTSLIKNLKPNESVRVKLINVNPFLYNVEIGTEQFETDFNDQDSVLNFFMPAGSVAKLIGGFIGQEGIQLLTDDTVLSNKQQQDLFVDQFVKAANFQLDLIERKYSLLKAAYETLNELTSLKGSLLLETQNPATVDAATLNRDLKAILVLYKLSSKDYKSLNKELRDKLNSYLRLLDEFSVAYNAIDLSAFPEQKEQLEQLKTYADSSAKKIERFKFPEYINDITAIYRSADPVNWVIVSGPVFPNYDEIDFNVKISPKANLSEYTYGLRSEDFNVTGWVKRPKLTISAGIFFSGLSGKGYSYTTFDSTHTNIDTTYALGAFGHTDSISSITENEVEKKKILQSEGEKAELCYGIMAHYQYPVSKNFALAVSAGTAVTNKGNFRHLLGGSLVFGYNFRIILNGGLAIGTVKELENGWKTDEYYKKDSFEDIPLKDALKTSWYTGITFNFKISRTSKNKSAAAADNDAEDKTTKKDDKPEKK